MNYKLKIEFIGKFNDYWLKNFEHYKDILINGQKFSSYFLVWFIILRLDI